MSFRTFTRTWWADDACTIPEAGERTYGPRYDTEEEAREHCRVANERRGPTGRGPRGLASEYTEV